MPADTEELDEKAVQTEGEAQEIDALDFPPGVLAPSEVNKQSPAIKFDDKGQNVGIPSAAVQNFHRTPTVTLPADVATAAPVLPIPGWQKRT